MFHNFRTAVSLKVPFPIPSKVHAKDLISLMFFLGVFALQGLLVRLDTWIGGFTASTFGRQVC